MNDGTGGGGAPPGGEPLKTRLVLFDIDGTLLTSGGAGERAMAIAIREYFNEQAALADPLEGIEMAGRTDTGIALQIFRKRGIDPSPGELSLFLDCYIRHLETELPRAVGTVLPGVFELLESLKRMPSVALALLTGNLLAGAKLKLVHYGVWHFFDFGAFADDHHDRNQLGPFAQARAAERHGVQFDPAHTFVLGDTPHDIDCGKAFGAKTVAIATGRYTVDELRAHDPDFLFHDLSQVPAVLATLGL